MGKRDDVVDGISAVGKNKAGMEDMGCEVRWSFKC